MANAPDPAAPQDRHIRVFVSSTFRDMTAERDHLVKFIFPELRRLCESRGVTWGEVDLRWGVTDEEAAEGKVLPICLEEIARCRPYFIGILGERYGWVPEAISSDLIEREPWLKKYAGQHRSVTELEILHGVLEDPKMANHAFFYFRDRAFLNKLPPDAKRGNFTSEDAESAGKLRDLKQRIKGSRFPVKEDYANPEALGKLVLADLTGVINALWPEGSQPVPLDREAMDHEAFARSRAGVYIGRQEYFDRLDAHANGGGDQPLVILGESGGGKSALLANWALKHRAAHPGELVLQHYIGGTPYSSDWAAMLRRIMGELKRKFGLAEDIPDQPDALRSAFPNWLQLVAAMGRVILILDALNQLEDRDGAPDLVWLPSVLPPNVRLIVSTLPGRALDEITKRRWPVLKVEPLDAAERRKFIGKYLKQYTKSLNDTRSARLADAPQCANPLYLRVLLEELRLFGEHERLDERISHYLEAQTIPALFERVLARWEQDYEGDTDLVGDAMTLLWAARRGLSESEILLALGRENEKGEREPLPRAKWSPFFLAAADSLVSHGGLLTFFHDYLREAVKNAYLPTDDRQRTAHLRLAKFFAIHSASPRWIDELPWQFARARDWWRLEMLLVDREFFKVAWGRNQFEVKSYWAQIEADSAPRVVQAYRDALERPDRVEDKRFLLCLSLFLGDTGHLAESLRLRTHLVDHYRQTGDRAMLQAALGNLALILYERGDLDGAMALHRQAEQICRELGTKDGLQHTLGNQALILDARGDPDGAMVLLKQAEQIARELGDQDGLHRALGNQASILKMRGDLDGAMVLHRQGEQISRELGSKDGLMAALGSQALILQARGDLDGAMALHQQHEQICRELGDQDGLQRTLGNQAVILQMRGDLDGALALHQQEEQICRALGKKDGLERTLSNQAVILYARGDLDGAMTLHQQAEQICRELGDKEALATSLGNQGNILYSRGDLDGAMALHQQEEQIFRELGMKEGLVRTQGNQALILQARGDLNGAMTLHQQVGQICRELGNRRDLAISLANLSLVLKQLGRTREALPVAEEALQMVVTHGYAALAQQIGGILNSIRQVEETKVLKPSSTLPASRSVLGAMLSQGEPTLAELRESAAAALRGCQWEAAETCLQKLLDQGTPLKTVAPDLITALLNIHAELPPANVTRVRKLISELEEYGHFDLALAARRQLEAKLPQGRKPWWKVW